MTRETLGDFEQLVLLACLHLGKEAYTVSVMREVEARTGRTLTHAAVYVALKRLERRGLVTSELGEPTSARGGRPKRFFRVEPRAVPELIASRDALLAMWEGLDPATGSSEPLP